MIRVLVVEGHEVVRDALGALLGETPGIEVAGIASGVGQALPLIDRHDPDIVLAGLSLGDGSAVEIVRAVKRSRRKARIVILTGVSDAFAATEALAGGAAGYVLKSQSPADLLGAIQTVAAGRRYVAPQVAASLPARSADETSGRSQRSLGLQSLSQREHEVFRQVVHGHTTKEVARRLHLSPKTVESHRTNINRKLAVRTAADLVRFAVAHGIVVAPRADAEQVTADSAERAETVH